MDIQNDATFVAPEGVYSLRDELKSPVIAAGATTAAAWTQYHTRVSTITVKYPIGLKPAGFQVGALLGMGSRDKDKDKEREKDKDIDKTSLSGSEKDKTDDDNTPDTSTTTEANGHTSPPMPPLFATSAATPGKKGPASKPKHNIRTTSSSFVTRMVSLEGLTKYLASKQGDVTYLFYNHGRSFFWTEPSTKHKDPLGRITFSHPPTCHAVNSTTASPSTIDILIAFPTGDIVWFDAISSRYVRLNKGGVVNGSCITAIKWVNSSNVGFASAHRDGSLIIWERERDDPPSTVWPEKLKEHESAKESWNSHTSILVCTPPWRLQLPTSPLSAPAISPFSPTASLSATLVNGNTPASPAEVTGPTFARKEKQSKNPVSYWQLSTRAILDFTFSPNRHLVATVSEDGCLRIIDAVNERLLDSYSSYFGALTCVSWSPDGRFVLTGGQDDLLTLYSPYDSRVVARCQGHSSFITSIAFDPSRCVDGRLYRFGSTAEDGRCILWDFSSTALRRPKHHAHHSSVSQVNRNSLSSSLSLVKDASFFGVEGEGRHHPAPPRHDVPILEPVVVKQIENEILSQVVFLPASLLTSTKGGFIKVWIRPLPPPSAAPSQLSKSLNPPGVIHVKRREATMA